MRGLLGFILGIIVTIAGAYVYDAQTGRKDNGLTVASTQDRAPIVNWAVLDDHWTNLRADMRVKAEDLHRTIRRHIG